MLGLPLHYRRAWAPHRGLGSIDSSRKKGAPLVEPLIPRVDGGPLEKRRRGERRVAPNGVGRRWPGLQSALTTRGDGLFSDEKRPSKVRSNRWLRAGPDTLSIDGDVIPRPYGSGVVWSSYIAEGPGPPSSTVAVLRRRADFTVSTPAMIPMIVPARKNPRNEVKNPVIEITRMM